MIFLFWLYSGRYCHTPFSCVQANHERDRFNKKRGFVKTLGANFCKLICILIIVGMTLVLRFVAGFGIILCGVGLLFTTFMSYVMLSHLYGQFWRSLGSIGSASTNTIVPGPTI